MSDSYLCVGCNQLGQDIAEYKSMAEQEINYVWDEQAGDMVLIPEPVEISNEVVNRWIYENEGTLNTSNGHFLCTDCYIKAGQPSSPSGWRAP